MLAEPAEGGHEDGCLHADGGCYARDRRCDDAPTIQIKTTSRDALANLVPDCVSGSQLNTPSCRTAIHEFCRRDACSVSGFGPVDFRGDEITVACVAAAEMVTIDFAVPSDDSDAGTGSQETDVEPDLQFIYAGCVDAINTATAGCQIAVHRYCTDLGYTTGTGPNSMDDDGMTVVCLSGRPQAHSRNLW